MSTFRANPKQRGAHPSIFARFERKRNKDWVLGKIQSTPLPKKSLSKKKSK